MPKHKPIPNPTWKDISRMFTSRDIEGMKIHGLDLSSYEQVSALAHKIYYYVAYKLMPTNPETKKPEPWSDESIITYNNWLIGGMPRDEDHRKQLAAEKKVAAEQAGLRIRKDITLLDETEIDRLKAAFRGLMDRDPKTPEEYDPNAPCYFSLAAKHWYPVPTFCQHHIYGYLPWHRWYMLDFENALRSIPGCEEVTLPYWNIETATFPPLFFEEPFKEYTFPIGIYPEYASKDPDTVGQAGTRTFRGVLLEEEHSEITFTSVREYINKARATPKFATYNGLENHEYDKSGHIIRAHDFGHLLSGLAMANQDISAFDPIFWFFHCNWDRLWWEWQVGHGAKDLEGFKNTLETSDDHRWLDDPRMSISDPFGKSNADSIDLSRLDIDYEDPKEKPEPVDEALLPIARRPSWLDTNPGQSELSTFSIAPENLDRLSLRVKGVNRIQIPGSFWVVLYFDDEEVGRDGFFQSSFSGNCENCVAQSKIDFDFVFDRKHLENSEGGSKKIKVEILHAITNEVFPFEKVGNPTINIRMLH